ncbi:MAG: hypothetical protein AB1714_28465 [Acidobacteriota bacterium]
MVRKRATTPPAEVPIGLVGCDFRVASSRWRSALVMSKEERIKMAADLVKSGMVMGMAFLDTCNRNEILYAAEKPAWTGEIIKAQMMKRWHGMNGQPPRPYVMVGNDATRHVLRVAAGLESFVVGERQITTQLNRALERSRKEGMSSVHLNGLGAIAARVARDVRRRAPLGNVVRGVHEVAARYILRHVKPPATVVVIGTGEIGRRVVGAIRPMPRFKVYSMNRTVLRGGGRVLPLTELPHTRADVIVACTAALNPVVTKANLPPGRRAPAQPLLLIDLGIPAQIDSRVAGMPAVVRVDLDNLLAEERLDPIAAERLGAASSITEDGLYEYAQFCQRRRFVTLLDATRKRHEEFISKRVPDMLDQVLPDADRETRGQIEYQLRGLIRQYTNSIFRSINESLAEEQ